VPLNGAAPTRGHTADAAPTRGTPTDAAPTWGKTVEAAAPVWGHPVLGEVAAPAVAPLLAGVAEEVLLELVAPHGAATDPAWGHLAPSLVPWGLDPTWGLDPSWGLGPVGIPATFWVYFFLPSTSVVL
jgi:hypothetical protein